MAGVRTVTMFNLVALTPLLAIFPRVFLLRSRVVVPLAIALGGAAWPPALSAMALGRVVRG